LQREIKMNLKLIVFLFLFGLSFSLLLISCEKKSEPITITNQNASGTCSIEEAENCSENNPQNETDNRTIKYVFNVSMGVEKPVEEEIILVEPQNKTEENLTNHTINQENGPPVIFSFERLNNSICTSNGKPILFMFGKTTCPYCNMIKDVYLNATKPYFDNGSVIIKLWEVDIKTNILNQSDPNYSKDYAFYFQKYSPDKVPFFNFGCRYIRLGIAFSTPAEEQKEFKAVIENLLFQLANKS